MQPLLSMPAGGTKVLIPALVLSFVIELLAALFFALSLDNGVFIGAIVAVAGPPAIVIVMLVIPMRYEVWSQQLSLVFLSGRRWDIPFNTIESVEAAKGVEAYAYKGVRFATAPAQAIVVKRKGASMLRRPNIVFSPEDRNVFLEQLQRALRSNPEA